MKNVDCPYWSLQKAEIFMSGEIMKRNIFASWMPFCEPLKAKTNQPPRNCVVCKWSWIDNVWTSLIFSFSLHPAEHRKTVSFNRQAVKLKRKMFPPRFLSSKKYLSTASCRAPDTHDHMNHLMWQWKQFFNCLWWMVYAAVPNFFHNFPCFQGSFYLFHPSCVLKLL